MYAIVDIAGQQFKVEKDQKLYVHRLKGKEGNKVSFERVLMIDTGNKVVIGDPLVKGASVEATIMGHVKGDKVLVFKKKRRKGYQKLNGHRQYLTQIQIGDISEKSTGSKAQPAEKAEQAPEKKAKTESKPKTEVKPKAEAKPKAETKAKAADKPKAETKAKAADKSKAEAKAKAADKPKAEAKAKAADKPKAETKAKAEGKSKATDEPKAEDKPEGEESSEN